MENLYNEDERRPSKPKIYACTYCRNDFSSYQALGGHQNAHKKEKALAKSKSRQNAATQTATLGYGPTSYHYQPYQPYSMFHQQVPFYGALNRSIGIEMESMIQKPYWSPSPFLTSHVQRDMMSRSYLIGPSNQGLILIKDEPIDDAEGLDLTLKLRSIKDEPAEELDLTLRL